MARKLAGLAVLVTLLQRSVTTEIEVIELASVPGAIELAAPEPTAADSCENVSSGVDIVDEKVFRDYSEGVLPQVVEAYRQQRTYQTHEFATRAAEKYCTFGPERAAPFWELFDKLMGFVDLSDPDISLSNHQHLFQTAEGLREDGHPEWMQFVGLAHDLGKVIHLRGGCDEDGTSMATQWGIVGDTFITGCAIPDTIVFPNFNPLNPDYSNAELNTLHGKYAPGSGLRNAVPSFGHDEYLYHMLKANHVDIPEAGYYMLRYHSLYPWHKEGEYEWLEDDLDREMKPWVQLFNKYDLYTKADVKLDEQLMRARYAPIVEKFAPHALMW